MHLGVSIFWCLPPSFCFSHVFVNVLMGSFEVGDCYVDDDDDDNGDNDDDDEY